MTLDYEYMKKIVYYDPLPVAIELEIVVFNITHPAFIAYES